jgi:hypothetical protein
MNDGWYDTRCRSRRPARVLVPAARGAGPAEPLFAAALEVPAPSGEGPADVPPGTPPVVDG